jgi:hypothetical protein
LGPYNPACKDHIEVTNESDTDTIGIDSINFYIKTERAIQHSEAYFRVSYQNQESPCVFIYGNENGTPYYGSSYNEALPRSIKKIPPKSTIVLSNFEMNVCIVCPLQKKSSSTFPPSPCHLEYNFIFVYKNGSDTLTFIGCQKYTPVIRISNGYRKVNSYELFNLNGRVQQYHNLKNGILIRKIKEEDKR